MIKRVLICNFLITICVKSNFYSLLFFFIEITTTKLQLIGKLR